MEVSYTLTARDLVLSTLRGIVRSHPAIMRRASIMALFVLLAPVLIVALFHGSASTILCGFLLFDIAAVLILAAGVAVVGQRLLAPLLDAPLDTTPRSISIGPDCFAESGASDIVTPWRYVASVAQDPWSISIEVGPDECYIIPRRAFQSYFASWVFSLRARRYWRSAHSRWTAVKKSW